jgi:hypothetical protein
MERSVLTRHDKFVLDSLFALQMQWAKRLAYQSKTSPERQQRLIRSWAEVRLGGPELFAQDVTR